eukprot:scaffold207776_cov21-Prasinocladus_malaysianus.AAC.3
MIGGKQGRTCISTCGNDVEGRQDGSSVMSEFILSALASIDHSPLDVHIYLKADTFSFESVTDDD